VGDSESNSVERHELIRYIHQPVAPGGYDFEGERTWDPVDALKKDDVDRYDLI
jgi:hypothetical protein